MKPMKHTPGPWSIFEHADHSGLAIGPLYDDKESPYLRGHVRDVCTISAWKRTYPREISKQQHANARLIAAAPEMLEALKAIIEAFPPKEFLPNSHEGKALNLGVEAIRKAEEGQ